jgi:undecaprenyl-diphosphatase
MGGGKRLVNILHALILGVVQGLAEFLPISSSTHLGIAKRLMGLEPAEWHFFFDFICHLGTLVVLIFFLRQEIRYIFKTPRLILIFIVATMPLLPTYFFLKPLRILWADSSGVFLMITGIWLYAASCYPAVQKNRADGNPANCLDLMRNIKYTHVLWIGLAQSMAMLPGISRSGSTISTARLLGWEWKVAARFSFLLSIPAIIGAGASEALHIRCSLASIPWDLCAAGFAVSLITAIGAVRLFFWMLDRGALRPFAWYCLVAGLALLIGSR